MSDRETTSIFMKNDIAVVVKTIFNGPMAAPQGQELLSSGGVFRKTGDAIQDFMSRFAVFQIAYLAGELKNLSQVGPIAGRIEEGTGGQGMGVQSAMIFANGRGRLKIR